MQPQLPASPNESAPWPTRGPELPRVPKLAEPGEWWHEVGQPTLSTPILLRVAAGDLTAVQSCMNRYGGLVWSLARRFSKNPSDAEDAVQEIFLDLWKSAVRFDPALSSESAFVVMVARRRLIDRSRKSRRAPATEAVSADVLEQLGSEAGGPEVQGEVALAEKALGQLKPDQRRVLMMAAVHGMSHEQISEATGLALGTVKTHARRGLLRVREILSIRAPDEPSTTEGPAPKEES